MIQGTYRIYVQCLLAENIEDDDQKGHWEKGYALPIDENEGKEAEADLRAALELTRDILENRLRQTGCSSVLGMIK